MMNLRQIRFLFWALSGLFSILLAGLVAWNLVVAPRVGTVITTGEADIGGPFEMVNSRGRTVDQSDFVGDPTVMFFGFTSCPDVCPTTLYEMTRWMEQLGSKADDMNFVFVSVDPERDTPRRLEDYLQAFDPRIQALTGSPEQLASMAEAYRFYYKRVPTNDSYTMEHTSRVYLMDEQGHFVDTIAYGESGKSALAKLRKL